MKKKIKVALLFGGKSSEHEVSVNTAKSVYQAINQDKYEVLPIYVSKVGQWSLSDGKRLLLSGGEVSKKALAISSGLINFSENELNQIKVVFPLIHGTNGEDGTIQGMLKLFNIPFVGADVLGSAIGMDKDVSKRLLKEAGIPVAKFLVFKKKDDANFDVVVKKLGLPFFVKPANCGSSVGVSKVKSKEGFEESLKLAFAEDQKILIEEGIAGREVECAVLGNDHPQTSVVGEIVYKDEFYSYETKYTDGRSQMVIPADIPEGVSQKIQQLSIKAFEVLCCAGMARVDFFLKGEEVFLNEINTIPGFTKYSMYPKLWEASGLAYPDLIDKLIQLALRKSKE